MSNKIVIIGNGAAGITAAETILQQNRSYSLTMITNEGEAAYYRPMLSEYISAYEIPKRFYLHSKDWYEENNIELLPSSNATKIDTVNKQVAIDNGLLIDYDKLIIACGSYNFIPPLPGASLKGVYNLRTLKDADEIKSSVSNGQKSVVIGGGLLGLELGWQLLSLGIDVTVVEMMPRLLPRQLDEEASKLFLQKVEATGIKIKLGIGTSSIIGEDNVTGVALENGEMIECDNVFISIGIRADTALAQEAGIKVNRGIIVDSNMRTSVEDVFAAGDCAEYEGVNYAIWPEAVAQGKIAALSACSVEAAYENITPFNIYHGMNLRLFSIGNVNDNDDRVHKTIKKYNGDNLEKYFFMDEVLVGGILLGDISKSSKLKQALINKVTYDEFTL